MPAYDVGFKIVARTAGQQLAGLAGVSADQWTPIVSEVQTAERLADRVFRAQRGRKRFVVYLEAYTYWTTDAPWSVLAKSGLLSERERLPTVSVVYILRPRGYRPQGGQFRLAVEEQEPTQQVWFREVCLWQLQPQPWWEEVPGLMALSPLCQQERAPLDILGKATQAITAHTPDTVQRADLLTTLAIFGRLAYPQIDVVQLIGREQMKESKVYDQIMEEGRVESRREDILAALEIRFGLPAAREFAPALNAITDSERLARLLRLTLRCSSVEQFRDRFPKSPARPHRKA
jgi:predicted transposase YdaD